MIKEYFESLSEKAKMIFIIEIILIVCTFFFLFKLNGYNEFLINDLNAHQVQKDDIITANIIMAVNDNAGWKYFFGAIIFAILNFAAIFYNLYHIFNGRIKGILDDDKIILWLLIIVLCVILIFIWNAINIPILYLALIILGAGTVLSFLYSK